MKRNKKYISFSLLLVLVLALTACGGNKEETPEGAEELDVEKEVEVTEETNENTFEGEKVLHDWTTSMTTYNPHMYTNSKTFLNYGTLVATMASKDGSSKLEFVPHHAKELPVSEDGLVFNVEFRDDLVWSDGTPIDANTYEYSMRMLLDPKLANKNAVYLFDTCIVKNAKEYFQGEVEWEDAGIKLIDDKNLEITLEYPASDLDFWTSIGTLIWPVHEEIYEANMNDDRTSTTYGTSIETTPSCGFFVLTEWITDGQDINMKNEDDPLVKEGYINIDKYERRYISENSTRAELFFSGQLDNHSLNGEDWETYKNDPRAHVTLSPNVWGFFVNGASKNKIMQDNDFRKALHYGAPREQAASDVFKLYPATPYLVASGIYVGNPIDGGDYYRDTERGKEIEAKFASDKDKALEYFDKAYEANGGEKVEIEYIYFEGQESQKRTAEIMQESYENLFGKDRFTFNLRAVPPMAAYDIYRSGEYDLGLGVRLANVFNPWSTMNVWTSEYADKYITGFSSEEFDELQFESTYGNLVANEEDRVEALARMEELLLDYVAFVPMFQNDNTVMYSDRVEVPSDIYLPFVGYGLTQADILSAN